MEAHTAMPVIGKKEEVYNNLTTNGMDIMNKTRKGDMSIGMYRRQTRKVIGLYCREHHPGVGKHQIIAHAVQPHVGQRAPIGNEKRNPHPYRHVHHHGHDIRHANAYHAPSLAEILPAQQVHAPRKNRQGKAQMDDHYPERADNQCWYNSRNSPKAIKRNRQQQSGRSP